MYHFAILFPTRRELATVYKRLKDAQYPLSGASDHGVSEAIYLEDPDSIGIELYVDRPEKEWIWENGKVAMTSKPLDLEALLKTLD